MSGILSLSVIIPIYILLFNFISPGYWDKYWLLANTAFGIKIIFEEVFECLSKATLIF